MGHVSRPLAKHIGGDNCRLELRISAHLFGRWFNSLKFIWLYEYHIYIIILGAEISYGSYIICSLFLFFFLLG
jgi:hypothetical protein